MHLYHYSAKKFLTNTTATFNVSVASTNTTTGYFTNGQQEVQNIADANSNGGGSGNYNYIQAGALIKFIPPAGKHFDKDNQLADGTVSTVNDKSYIYATVVSNTVNSVVLSTLVPSGAVVDEITPVFKNNWSSAFITNLAGLITAKKNFGVRYDTPSMTWSVIEETNLSTSEFDISTAGTSNDSSWFLSFSYFGGQYTVNQRNLYYYIESELETRFYFDPKVKVYDSATGTIIKDHIKVLKVNSQPDNNSALAADHTWYVYDNVIQIDGYQDTQKVLVTFPDENNDGIPDDPTLFDTLVAPTVNTNNKYVFFKQVQDYDNFIKFEVVKSGLVNTSYATQSQVLLHCNSYADGQVFYAYTDGTFYVKAGTTATQSTSYIAKTGRQDLYFQYRHNSPSNRRIDPSPNNIMDLYILTKEYNTNYAAWIKDTSGKVAEPVAPTTEELRVEFEGLENLKALSDTIIYNPAKFKPIFGNKAESVLRATFKVVKNPNVSISDNDVKSRVIATINKYFDINNWDFGETFYFSELSAYLHTMLVPNISSIIIVPTDTASAYGGLHQINAEANEIVVSAATVDNVEIISAITASQINQTLLG